MSTQVPGDPTAPVPDVAMSTDALSTPVPYPWATTYPEASPYPESTPHPHPVASGPVATQYGTTTFPSVSSPVAPRGSRRLRLPLSTYPPGRRRRRWLYHLLGLVSVVGLIAHIVDTADADHNRSELTSDTGCAVISHDIVGLGVQVINSSRQTVTLTGATVHGLPSDLVGAGPATWVGCAPTDQPVFGFPSLAPGAKQWVLVSMTLRGTCPGEASPTITVSYTDDSRARTTDFPVGLLSDAVPCPPSAP